MKKLAIVLFSTVALAAPAYACPSDGAESTEHAPKTAEKTKTEDKDKAKAAPAKEADKPKATDKTAKPTEKKPEKVSSK